MQTKFSIIIPVYNAEKYIKNCVSSIIQQNFQDFEVILVDDESTDCSGKICDALAKDDQRIKVIHQKNKGTSGARNSGIRLAVGDYIMFMDNDDYWNSNGVLGQLCSQIKERNADVIMFDNCTYWESEKKFTYSNYKITRDDFLKAENPILHVIQHGQMSRAVWNKAVKRDLIIRNELWFKENIRNEDTDWTAHLIQSAESYDWCEKIFYTYRKGHASAQTSGKITYKMWCDLKNIVKETVNNAQKMPREKKEALLNYISYPYAVCMGQIELIHDMPKEGLKNDIKELKEYGFLLKISKDPYVKKIKYCYSVLGWNVTVKAISTYIKMKYKMS